MNLETYATEHGTTAEAFLKRGWSETTYRGKPALKLATGNGDRFRLFEGESKYISSKGFKNFWYRLGEATEIAEKTNHPLIICNGEASTVAGLERGLPATCFTGGEKTRLPDSEVGTLQKFYKKGNILIALDCDDTGRRSADGLAEQLRENGFSPFIIRFDKYEARDDQEHYDFADWLRDNPEATSIPGNLIHFDIQETEEEVEAKTEGSEDLAKAIEQIAERFPWETFVEAHFGDLKYEANMEIRALGNGGLHFNPEKKTWVCYSIMDGSHYRGGGVVELVQYEMFRDRYKQKDYKGQWREALHKAASIAGVVLPQRKPRRVEITQIDASIDQFILKANRTDTGNAEIFELLYKDEVRYNHSMEKWLIWTGTRWEPDTRGHIFEHGTQIARCIQAVALTVENLNERKAIAQWGFNTENLSRKTAMITSAQSRESLAMSEEQFDTNLMVAAATNGTLDLTACELRESKREDYITKSLGTHYDAEADCPRWQQFIMEVFNGNQELVDYIQRAVGYSLTGDTREQCLFLLHGNGLNGKSTFLEVITALMGGYANTASFATFDAGTKNEQTNDLAKLKGARFVSIIEADEDRRLNEAKVKSVTGQDTITCRFLHKEFFTYKPQFKIWLAMNHLPTVYGTDNGIWRRLRLIPFNQSFEGREDKTLNHKLLAELPGILNWALEGLKEWQKQGLNDPEIVREATRQYRTSSDIIAQWIESDCKLGAKYETIADIGYRGYTQWAQMRGDKPMTYNKWGRRMGEMGFSKEYRKISGKTMLVYLGIGAEIVPSRFQ